MSEGRRKKEEGRRKKEVLSWGINPPLRINNSVSI
jgi:hypothetical protein